MKEATLGNFGLVIAYLVPGFTALWGASSFSSTLRTWLATAPTDAPTIGGFLYVTISSIAVGLVISTVRWAVLDTIHHWTGVRPNQWNFSKLQKNLEAFNVLIEIHYRYYQHYSNMFVALVFLYVGTRISGFATPAVGGWFDIGMLTLEVAFFLGSRDTLKKYYSRVDGLLGARK